MEVRRVLDGWYVEFTRVRAGFLIKAEIRAVAIDQARRLAIEELDRDIAEDDTQ